MVEVKMEEKQEQRKSSFLGLSHRSRRDSADERVEALDKSKFHELLALSLPDWYLVLLGVINASILGALFPVTSVIFSRFIAVGVYLTSPNSFLLCFC